MIMRQGEKLKIAYFTICYGIKVWTTLIIATDIKKKEKLKSNKNLFIKSLGKKKCKTNNNYFFNYEMKLY